MESILFRLDWLAFMSANFAKRNHAWSVWETASGPCTYRERYSLKKERGADGRSGLGSN